MDTANKKIMTVSFLAFAGLIGFTLSSLLKVLSGAFGVIAKMMDNDMFRHGLPVAVAAAIFIYLQTNKNVMTWANEVIAEIRKVVWPPVKDTRGMTIVVVVMVLISSVIVSVFDMFSGFVLNQLMK